MKLLFQVSLLTSLAFYSHQLFAGQDFDTILQATKSIVAGKTFKCDEGHTISYGEISVLDSNQAFISVIEQSVSGDLVFHRDVIFGNFDQTFLHELVDADNRASYLMTYESPFHVLRFMPDNQPNSELLSKECYFDKPSQRSICYFKYMVNQEVFVMIYKEVK